MKKIPVVLLLLLFVFAGCSKTSEIKESPYDKPVETPFSSTPGEAPESYSTETRVKSSKVGQLNGVPISGVDTDSLDVFSNVKEGTTYKNVVRLIGCEGKELEQYQWDIKDGDFTYSLNVNFLNGKVFESPDSINWTSEKIYEGASYNEVEKIVGKSGKKTDNRIYLWYAYDKIKKGKMKQILCQITDGEVSGFVISTRTDKTPVPKSISEINHLEEFFEAVNSGSLSKVKSLLKRDPKLINAKDPIKNTPLMVAVKNRNNKMVELLLSEGADINAECRLDGVPLSAACKTGDIKMVKLLISKGADLNGGRNDMMPLRTACQEGNLDLVKLLISKGAKLENNEGIIETPLHIASQKGDVKLAEFLLEKKVNIDAVDDSNCTPLMIAVINEKMDMVKLLVSKGADVNRESGYNPDNNIKVTPLSIATFQTKNTEMADFLKKHGAKILKK